MVTNYEKSVHRLAESVPKFLEHNARGLKILLILAEIETIKEDDHRVEELKSRAKELLQKNRKFVITEEIFTSYSVEGIEFMNGPGFEAFKQCYQQYLPED